jgi:isopropylmalate/homocitrate/citramalate synthase
VDNIAIWAKKLGLQLNDQQTLAVLNQVKLKSHDLKRVLTEKEFKEILNRMEAGR